ncbi:MFS transporter [Pseudonocardia sp. DSM 110487]|uniref:MFS transporter n=1 Tax=Pseudonocardia sp. DSM 110487 TaxID=2865833 RepID=UPI001C6A551D|nr:MFS transporter [Pseudonocardia sp. DSM 110487]QYN37046.1 MFS transporter [Pseudonocardia sp. DSM 110487]
MTASGRVAGDFEARRHGVARLIPAAGLGACPAHPDVPAAARPPGETTEGARRCQRWTLAVVCLASALLLFNVTAPNVALPAIAADLSAGFSAQQWVLSSYAMVLASLLLAGGALGDRYGRRRMFLLGLAGFWAGSLLCTLAPTTGLLIVGRLVQGAGAAALFPSGLALIAAEFDGPARARAIGVWGASVSGAIALGPLLGGILVEAVGWRAQFALAVVLVLPTAAVGMRHLRESRDSSATRLDWWGAALLTGAMVLLIVLVQRGNAAGWLSPITLGMAGAALVLFALFTLVEFRTPTPLIAPALMRNPTFLGATLVAVVFAAAGFAPLVYLTLFLLHVHGSSPTLAGLEVAPFAVASLVVSLLAARVVARLGVRIALVGGLALCGAGLALMVELGPESGGLRLLPALLVFGIGAGVVNPTMTVAALSTVDAAHSGMASGINNTARQLGIAGGIAGLGAVFETRLADGTGARLTAGGVPAPQATAAAELAASGDLAAAGRSLGQAETALLPAYTTSFTHALTIVFVVGIGVIALGALVAVVLIRPAAAPGRTGTFTVVGDAEGRPTEATCTHLDGVRADVPPSTDKGCEDCLRDGGTWVHLRKCLRCGHVGCCDNSPGRHASGHWHASSHPIVQSHEPGEDWGWCYADQLLLQRIP